MENKDHIDVSKKKLDGSFYENSQILGILVSAVIVLLSLLIYAWYSKRKAAGKNILLLGLCDSGKTLIFAQLVHNKYVLTQTSVRENVGDYYTGNVTLQIVDIPGHERLRNQFFDNYKSSARGLVFIIDSLTVQKDIQDVAEYLYNCLSDPVILSLHPPLLILCNKQDEAMAKGSALIKTLLEKEMNILRKTKTSQLESVEQGNSNVFIGKEGKDFEFSHLAPLNVELAESSALSHDDEEENYESKISLENLQEWLQKLS